jgi:hypothetical protein
MTHSSRTGAHRLSLAVGGPEIYALRTVTSKRRNELLVAGATAVAIGVFVIVAAPFPPLLKWCGGSYGWARGIEFFLLNMVAWIPLGALGFLPIDVGVGADGISTERRELEDQREHAAERIEAATRQLIDMLERAAELSQRLAENQLALEARLAVIEQQPQQLPLPPGQAPEAFDV